MDNSNFAPRPLRKVKYDKDWLKKAYLERERKDKALLWFFMIVFLSGSIFFMIWGFLGVYLKNIHPLFFFCKFVLAGCLLRLSFVLKKKIFFFRR